LFDLAMVRAIFVLVLSVSAYVLHPFQLSPWISAAGGLLIGCSIILFEIRLERISLTRLIGAAFGSVLGIFGAFLISLVLSKANPEPFVQVCLLLFMGYIGLVVGATKGDMLNLAALGGVFGVENNSKKSCKILDTSVIIDGRIADIAETGFLDGVLVIPSKVEDEVLALALEKASGEKVVRKAIEAGMTSTEAFRKYGIL